MPPDSNPPYHIPFVHFPGTVLPIAPVIAHQQAVQAQAAAQAAAIANQRIRRRSHLLLLRH